MSNTLDSIKRLFAINLKNKTNLKRKEKERKVKEGHAQLIRSSEKSILHGLLMLPGKAKFVSCSIIGLGLSF